MTPPHDHGARGPQSAATPVYEQALAAVIASLDDEMRAARDRLATPAETAVLRHRIAALEVLRRGL